jgi:hypothetical protein
MQQAAAVYPGPYQWVENGIHRYGFHGINHQYCSARAMSRKLVWRDEPGFIGWTCDSCEWVRQVSRFASPHDSEKGAKEAFDAHKCAPRTGTITAGKDVNQRPQGK